MQRARQLELLDALLVHTREQRSMWGDKDSQLAASVYIDAQRAAREREVLLTRYPLVLGHASALAEPGQYFTHDDFGRPLVVARDREGVLRAYLNVCRHRGCRVVDPSGASETATRAKSFVCPYHGWTYDLAGQLVHIPQQEAFPSVDMARTRLEPLAVSEAAGLLWLLPSADYDLAGYLGPFAADLEGFDLGRHAIYRSARDDKRCNWKLVMDAFLESYHIKQLHRKTLHRFFEDGAYLFDTHGDSVRIVGSRTHTLEAAGAPRDSWRIREMATVYYHFFPNTILLFHPDYVSLAQSYPDARPERCRWTHQMLIPAAQHTPERAEHWAKSYKLIEETVFQREDLAAAESIQVGLAATGGKDPLNLGRVENLVSRFHGAIERALAAARTAQKASLSL